MSELLGIARFKFREGKRKEYLRLSDQAMDIVRTKDSGTLQYDIYLNGDQSECMVIERYRDSEAAIEHADNLGDLFGAVLATVSLVHGELLGEPSAELRAKLAGSEVPVLFTPYRSMSTWHAGLDAESSVPGEVGNRTQVVPSLERETAPAASVGRDRSTR